MARKVQVFLVDDLDGTELGENGETVAFGMGGERYEIDLSTANAKKFRDMMGSYVEHARNVTRMGGGGSRRGRSGGGSTRSGMDREQSAAVRAWAKKNGWPDLADRGRVPREVVDAYHANQPRLPEPKAATPAAPKVNGTASGTPASGQPAKPAANSQTAEKPAAKGKAPATA